MTGWVAILGPFLVEPALACPGGEEASASCGDTAENASAEEPPDPGRSARRADLVGPGACSFTTEMVAQRVLEEGTPWSYVGRLAPAAAPLPSKVAAPFTIGPEGSIRVVANEILEDLQARGQATGRLELVGRVLEVDGTMYFVATSIRAGRS